MIDDLWALLGQLRQCPRSMRLVNVSPYIILCALGYAFYDERLHTMSITQTGRDALADRDTQYDPAIQGDSGSKNDE